MLWFAGCEQAAAPATSGSAQATYTCTVDANCILACDVRGECCRNPYCSSVMHRDESAANAKYNEQHCTAELRKECPDVGSIDPSFVFPTPRCRAGKCVGEK